MNLEEEIEKFKKLLKAEKNSGVIFSEFAKLMDLPSLKNMGKVKKKSKLIDTILKEVANALDIPYAFTARIIYVKEFDLYHGIIFVGKRHGNIFYFEDIDMGLITFSEDAQGIRVHCRVAGEMVPEVPGGIITRKKSKTVH